MAGRNRIPFIESVLFGLGAVSCSGGGISQASSPFEQLCEVETGFWNYECNCYWQDGGIGDSYFESAQECHDAFSYYQGDKDACIVDVLSQPAANPTVQCLLDARLESIACGDALGCPADPDPDSYMEFYTECAEAYYQAYLDCPPLPASIDEQLDECDDYDYDDGPNATLPRRGAIPLPGVKIGTVFGR